ncbi:hypothetical protein AB0F52_02625 [Amycolatopsis sp. NPDC024027]|uniref:hypothetical protein n=1 Tax=Amycolatopsis sp. NPDC024027 TaxID=3154327 RepID=UPI003407C356
MKKVVAVLGAVIASSTILAGSASAATANPAQTNATCYVASNRHLICGNTYMAVGYADRNYESFRGYLYSTVSDFNCWGRGIPNHGGNEIWYWAQLDSPAGAWGNVPAEYVYTQNDPPAGMAEC